MDVVLQRGGIVDLDLLRLVAEEGQLRVHEVRPGIGPVFSVLRVILQRFASELEVARLHRVIVGVLEDRLVELRARAGAGVEDRDLRPGVAGVGDRVRCAGAQAQSRQK